ncbi:MAG TPA: hypothetical protein VGT61_16400 [Thermomicrobiales bacterium]|jgi:hypothetical protein|nr:hypothetical protein [Thermomicrobiales bacterium]
MTNRQFDVTQDDRAGISHPASSVGALRERIYATLTAVSVLTLLLIHVDDESAASALTSLVLSLGTLWLASLLSEFLAHGVFFSHTEDGRHGIARDIFFTAGQSLVVMIVPSVFLLLSLTDLLSLRTALILAIGSMMLTLVAAALFAVRRTVIPFWGRVLIVLAEVLLGLVVIVGKTLTH